MRASVASCGVTSHNGVVTTFRQRPHVSDSFEKTMIGVLPQRADDEEGEETLLAVPAVVPREADEEHGGETRAADSIAAHLQKRRREAGLKTQRLNIDALDWDLDEDPGEEPGEALAEGASNDEVLSGERSTVPFAAPRMAESNTPSTPAASEPQAPESGRGTMLLGGGMLEQIRAAANAEASARAESAAEPAEPSAPSGAEVSAPSPTFHSSGSQQAAARGTMLLGAAHIQEAIAAAETGPSSGPGADLNAPGVRASAGSDLTGARTEMPPSPRKAAPAAAPAPSGVPQTQILNAFEASAPAPAASRAPQPDTTSAPAPQRATPSSPRRDAPGRAMPAPGGVPAWVIAAAIAVVAAAGAIYMLLTN